MALAARRDTTSAGATNGASGEVDPRAATMPMAQPLIVVFSGGTPPCRITRSGPDAGPIGAACQKGGIIEAKRAMKDLVKRAKANGHRFNCDGCHRDLDSYLLLDGAREDLARLVDRAG
jgi:hypothetical protein